MEKEMVGSRTKAKAKVEAKEKVDTGDVDLAKARKEKEKEKEEKEKASKADVDIVVETTTRTIAGISQATMMRCKLDTCRISSGTSHGSSIHNSNSNSSNISRRRTTCSWHCHHRQRGRQQEHPRKFKQSRLRMFWMAHPIGCASICRSVIRESGSTSDEGTKEIG